jgi:lauroyl/myristoyl acyltransferase
MTPERSSEEGSPVDERRSGGERRLGSTAGVAERRSMGRRAADRLIAAREEAAVARANVGGRIGALEAPHRRLDPGSRILEKTGVGAYRAMAWLLQRVPARPAWLVGGWVAEAGYRMWPKKREWLNANFGHVLGLPPDHPAVRKLALAAYRNYGRYLVDLMRLPGVPPEKIGLLVEPGGLELLEKVRADSRGLILAAAHVGNNEAVAAGMASLGLPISVVADDSAFPEMFELLGRQRAAWGIKLIPWRKLREMFGVLRRDEMLALLVDWGYRSDGIPVRLFDSWTCLPAGPAALAGKTGATILPIVVRRRPDGRMYVGADTPIKVRSTDPIEIGRATQAVALALQRIVAAAPDQWYSFKPMWPPTQEEAAALAERPEAEGARQYLAELDGSGAGRIESGDALTPPEQAGDERKRSDEPPVSRGQPASASGGA